MMRSRDSYLAAVQVCTGVMRSRDSYLAVVCGGRLMSSLMPPLRHVTSFRLSWQPTLYLQVSPLRMTQTHTQLET